MDAATIAVIFGLVQLRLLGQRCIFPDPEKMFNRRAVERCHILTIRFHNGSREAVLCGGLTRPCADALVNDLTAEITDRKDKARQSGAAAK